MAVFASFVLGVAIYVGLLDGLVSKTLAQASFTKAVTIIDLFGK